ncbi:BgTH12-01253 [Blumeria graminis f. sp. triticale]|uniref:BgTH12-01253 n=1 Tax=Blumeria graminis f. sp. triticale TaxID=1689686 RepID=A0A9W4DSF6_BLUGR|nr:BgTH12-01253 [Blumeria graminis f. sp. triticale]
MRSLRNLRAQLFPTSKFGEHSEEGKEEYLRDRSYNPRNAIVIDLTKSDNENDTTQDITCPLHASPILGTNLDNMSKTDATHVSNINISYKSSDLRALDTEFPTPESSRPASHHRRKHKVASDNGFNQEHHNTRKRGPDENAVSDNESKRKRRRLSKKLHHSADTNGDLTHYQNLISGQPKLFPALQKHPAVIISGVINAGSTIVDSEVLSSTCHTQHQKNTGNLIETQTENTEQLPGISREKLVYVLENQIFIHVRQAIRPFRDALYREDRVKIGVDAVREVIEQPEFEKHFKANGGTILSDYESLLAAQVFSYVNRCVRQMLGDELVNRLINDPVKNQKYRKKSYHTALRNEISIHHLQTPNECEEILRYQDTEVYLNKVSPNLSRCVDFVDLKAGSKPQDYSNSKFPSDIEACPHQAFSPTCMDSPTRASGKWEYPQQYHSSVSSGYKNIPYNLIGLRPYMTNIHQNCLLNDLLGNFHEITLSSDRSSLHVPFSEMEIRCLISFVQPLENKYTTQYLDAAGTIANLITIKSEVIEEIINSVSYTSTGFAMSKALHGRTRNDISAFLLDIASSTLLKHESKLEQKSFIESSVNNKNKFNPINRLLRHREIDGLFPARICRGQTSYREVVSSCLEDLLDLQSYWADCSNDIAAITWTNDNSFIVGALAHSDPHNMQYNKPGNLLVGSVVLDTVKSYPEHKIERPIISESQNMENASHSMRATQSPWLYTSVVSTAHSSTSGYSFTSSYDKTVKVWQVSENGSKMSLCGTWKHEAKVNFVVTSEHHDRVATAAGTNKNAVRVYRFDKDAISDSPYHEYGGNKSQEQAGGIHVRQTWAYQPATIKWARAPCVSNLFLVGYSPRADSDDGDDSNIPSDKKNTGELCVWNSENGSRLNVSSARMQNVFDVVWHPHQPVFAAATSPSGNYDSDRTKTQVRIYALNDLTFTSIMALDCPALDITELTIMPNSAIKAYITASCTDSCTYVWDMAQGEDPIHILRHGESLDNPEPDLPIELADGGVTFSAWGAELSRFYTGATDGKLIAWDVRKSPGNAFVRNVLELSGGISSGAFTKDFRRLLIGDSTGKIHLLGIRENDLPKDDYLHSQPQYCGTATKTSGHPSVNNRRPKIIIPHLEPPPPKHYWNQNVKKHVDKNTHSLLDQGILRNFPGKGIFQGPNYGRLGLYRVEAHENGDPKRPLLPKVMANQQFLKKIDDLHCHVPKLPRLSTELVSVDRKAHNKNLRLNFDFSSLSLETKRSLRRDRAELSWDESNTFQYELMPRSIIFCPGKSRTSYSQRSEASYDMDELAMSA